MKDRAIKKIEALQNNLPEKLSSYTDKSHRFFQDTPTKRDSEFSASSITPK